MYTKCYSTVNSKYSTIGRRNLNIESKVKKSELKDPKYGKAKASFEAKKELEKLIN